MGDIANTRRTNWNPTWSGTSLGYVDEVDPDFEIDTESVMVGTFGKMVLGERIVGIKGKIKVQVRESTLAIMQTLCPWWSSGIIPLTPTGLNIDYYTYADVLTLHPADLAVATVNQDLNFLKAVPIRPPAGNFKRSGEKDDVWPVEFLVFPDRTKLALDPPQMVYGYVGAIPA